MMLFKEIKVITEKECELLLNIFESNKERFTQSSNNGEVKYSAFESVINKDFPEVHDFLVKTIKEKNIAQLKNCEIIKSFACRYSSDSQTYMPYHYDLDNYTLLIYLNDDFKGGGTHFPLIKKVSSVGEVGIGNGILFNGLHIKSWHGALPISSGVRYTISVRIKKKGVLSLLKKMFNLSILILVGNVLNKTQHKYGKIRVKLDKLK